MKRWISECNKFYLMVIVKQIPNVFIYISIYNKVDSSKTDCPGFWKYAYDQ